MSTGRQYGPGDVDDGTSSVPDTPESKSVDPPQRNFLHPPRHWQKAVIVCEHAAVWIPVAPLLGVDVERGFYGIPSLRRIYQQYKTGPWLPVSRIGTGAFCSADVVLVSGSLEFVTDLVRRHGSEKLVVALEGFPCFRAVKDITLVWNRVDHTSLGGVTSGRFWVGCSSELGSLSPPSGVSHYRWRLRHVVNAAHHGRRENYQAPCDPDETFDSPVASSEGGLHPGGLLPVSDIRASVTCPSVFNGTKWCNRPLGHQELGACFDLPSGLLDEIGPSWSDLDPFVKSVPMKVLSFVGQLVLSGGRLLLPSVELRQGSSPDEKLGGKGGVGSTFTDASHLENRETDLRRSKVNLSQSVKLDDAIVPVWLWGERIVTGFPNLEYNQTVEKALDVLRRFLVRIWRRRILRSLRRYMTATHGPDWTMLVNKRGGVSCVEASTSSQRAQINR